MVKSIFSNALNQSFRDNNFLKLLQAKKYKNHINPVVFIQTVLGSVQAE